MRTLSLRQPQRRHDLARQVTKDVESSVNQLIALALTENLSVLKNQELVEERAKYSSRAKFERAMAKVAKREPGAYGFLKKAPTGRSGGQRPPASDRRTSGGLGRHW
jgi:hypothetical protein